MGGNVTNDSLKQNLGTVVVVLLRIFDKTETIDITNVALSVGPE